MVEEEKSKENKRIIRETEDGSHTLFIPEMEEHYHSVKGALQESEHVFIDAGFRQIAKAHIRILEIGFGTGLNAFLSLCAAEEMGKTIEYYTIERYPLEEELIGKLNYGALIAPDKKELFSALHRLPWNSLQVVNNSFSLCKIEGDANSCPLPGEIDLVYFDAFAPEKQPEMWNISLFEKIYAATAPHALFVTYCAKGEVRRNLQSVGFRMERLPGPPGKRHILRGERS
ncbi:tRNA (5-methylaminomethyl-2-thiouridine)(34)-methyltransferase MnmD [Parabacteroides sp. OttesenSCG-928-K15]|nr:tRNA (5-methylaminomethyl-2-thiouridine)(34)-methyltransferase MnmD [Parabacteroides sp. OttesenSCG-928-K15]